MREIELLIEKFLPITLSDMDEVKLMNRTDTKFTFLRDELSNILSKMIDYYFILDINGIRVQRYKSLYYDTDDRKFYIDHHNQRVNRNKVRFREYVDSGLTFLEVKLKNNKRKTIKKRIQVDEIPCFLSKEHVNYINDIIGKKVEIKPKQWINFSRITFVHKIQKERLTIDLNLNFSKDNIDMEMQDIVIAEIKQERMTRQSDFIRITKEMSILPMRLSKYCFSTMKLEPKLKYNRF